MLNATDESTIIAILGENPVVGKALETLLLSSDLGARFFIDYPAGSAERLDGARVALILPTSSTVRGKALMERIKSSPATADLQIIELITTPNEERNGHIRLLWPCSLQELKGSIEAALLKNPEIQPAG
jgi:hypothetical protein